MRLDREESLDNALGQIERQFGKGSVMRMNDAAHVSTGAISTGSLTLDLALGVGGLPRGRIVEVFGPESSGKTTLVYHVIAEAQRRGGICAFIDAEHAMDPQYARRIGVNIDELLVSQPDHGEQALEIAELLIRSGALDVVAVDSVAALTPKAEIEGEMGDSHVGLQARLMSQALRKLAGTLNRTDTICLFTNQLREKIGVMFGSPETTPGGRALKFYSSVRLDIRRIETLKEGVEAIGNRVRVKVVKNKVAPPFKQAEFDIIYGSGISWEGTVLEAGLERKVVQKSGSYFSFDEERLGQGRQNAAAFLREHPDVSEKIVQRIQAELGEGGIASARLLPARRSPWRRTAAPKEAETVNGEGRRQELAPCARGRADESRSSSTASRGGRFRPRSSSRAGLDVGVELDRERARRVRASCGEHEAMAAAPHGRSRSRDLSAARARANGWSARNVARGPRQETVERLARRGRGRRRAASRERRARVARRARRGRSPRSGTTWRRGGIAAEPVEAAIEALEPEDARAARIVAERGSGPRDRALPGTARASRRRPSRARAKKSLRKTPLRLYDEWSNTTTFCLHTRSFRIVHPETTTRKHLDSTRDDAERGSAGTGLSRQFVAVRSGRSHSEIEPRGHRPEERPCS